MVIGSIKWREKATFVASDLAKLAEGRAAVSYTHLLGQLAAARAERRLDHEAQAAVKSELSLLRDQFAGTPYPPTGTAAGAVALAKLVGRVEWVAGNAALLPNEAASLELCLLYTSRCV